MLDEAGQMEHDRVRIPTPYPLSPQKLVTVLVDLVKPLPPFDRVSVGFPGMVRDGRILSAPHFVSPDGPAGVARAQAGGGVGVRFDLESDLARALGKPTKVANDADVQGSAVVAGKGFELVFTLGTGVGTAFFLDGRLLPHFEFSHTPFRKGGTYNEQLGESARQGDRDQEVAGAGARRRRDLPGAHLLRLVLHRRRQLRSGITADLPANVILVDNSAGILGGIKLWERTD